MQGEVLNFISNYLYENIKDFASFRRSFRRCYQVVPEVKRQEEFQEIQKKRYRKDSLRVFKDCHHSARLEPSEKFAQMTCEILVK